MATIVRIVADEKLKRRLEAMGAVQGAPMEIFSANNGNLLVKIEGAKIGLNRELAMRIFVSPVTDSEKPASPTMLKRCDGSACLKMK